MKLGRGACPRVVCWASSASSDQYSTGDERSDLALALDDQPQRHRLHAAADRRPLHPLPQQRADLVAHQPVEDAPRLLGIDQAHVDVAAVANASAMAFRVISWKTTRCARSGGMPTASSRCQAIASPSRSGSVAR